MPRPVAHVVGARPNFMKAAPVIDALSRYEGGRPGAHEISQLIIHTGQHYDPALSDVFFEELAIPEPDVNLGVGSGSHAQQTAALLPGLEDALAHYDPACVVVYGDVNSTLAAALVCAKLLVPLVHVEAGLRSFDMTMPEEVNRKLTDAVADLLLVTSPEAIGHLANEGVDVAKVRFVGNTMIDTLLRTRHRLDPEPVRRRLGLPERIAVVTLHRPANVDDTATAGRIVKGLQRVADDVDVVVPLHPRGRERLAALGLGSGNGVHVVDPLGYVDFLSLVRGAALVLTDSGGIQEETTILDVPCLTIRPNTERPITITHGTNQLVQPDDIADAAAAVLAGETRFPVQRPPLWDGFAGERCAHEIAGLVADRPD